MKYSVFFNWLILQFYKCDIISGFCRSGHNFTFYISMKWHECIRANTVLAMTIIIYSQLNGLMSWYKFLLIDKVSSAELANFASI